ncbi:hypothetical protein EVG20_g6509 [Dentipellis fragilis]|uniref:DNA polymerase epsilon subunit D n=1 Tax=Dentipellis fragilis TaxID=205917 RepID=A0A4Y9YME8_9AGAM|nr:hypothetical protein EVG20_g6509 [Dentipellis fragilis]
MPRKDTANTPSTAQAQQDAVSEGIENFELPRSLVTRIARSALPENTKMQKDTVLSLVKGSTVFINYLAATAHDVAHSKQHKSISASDVLKALEIIEFGDLVGTMQTELLAYRDNAKNRKNSVSVPSGLSASVSAAQTSVPGTVAGKGKAPARPKGKERAEPSEAVSAPLLPTAQFVEQPLTNGVHHQHPTDVDQEMIDAAEAAGVETGEGLDDDEVEEDEEEEEADDDEGDEDEDQTEEAGDEDVEMGGLQEDNGHGEADRDE